MSKDATPQTLPCLVIPQPRAAEIVLHLWECIAWPKKIRLPSGRCLIQAAGPRPGPDEPPATPREGGALTRQPEAILGDVEAVQVVRATDCQLYGAGYRWAILFRNPRVYLDPIPQDSQASVPWRVRSVAPVEVAEAAEHAETPQRFATWLQAIRDGIGATEAARRGLPMD